MRCKEPIRQSLPPNRLSTQEKTAIRTLAARTPRPSPGVGGRAAMQRLSIGGSWTARWDSWQFGVGILGTQFFESAEKSPLGLDRRQWVRDLEGRALVPDDLDRHGAQQRTSFDPQHSERNSERSWPGTEVFALRSRTGTRQCPVAYRRPGS